MSNSNVPLEEAVVRLLLQAPENWQPTPSDLAQQERQALEALVGAGLVERRITFAVRLPGQTEQATISIEVTGEFGLAEAMEAAVQDLWLRWGERWAELHKQIDTPRPIVEVQENLWRLTADGESAQTDLGGTLKDRQRVIDFVLKRGFFDGTPKRLPDGRITRRQPVQGYGRLLRCQIENAPSGPVGVQVANWAEGAEAFAQAFERLFQAFTPPAKESPTPKAEPEFIFRQEGGAWRIKAFGEEGLFPPLKGLAYIAELVGSGSKRATELEAPSKDIRQEVPSKDGLDWEEAEGFSAVGFREEVPIDQEAQQSYKQRLQELEEEIEEAQRNHDLGRLANLQEEKNQILQELLARPTDPEKKRLVKRIVKNLEKAYQTLEKTMPKTAWHFRSSIFREGELFYYRPVDPPPWNRPKGNSPQNPPCST